MVNMKLYMSNALRRIRMPEWIINLGEFVLILAMAFALLMVVIMTIAVFAPPCGADGQLMPGQVACKVSDAE
jgi:hypothetical protein